MNLLRTLSDESLLNSLQDLIREERRITRELLRYLREVDARKIWAQRGFSSLHEYLMKVFGYSEGAASRRVQAMRLERELPEAGEAIEVGKVSLSTAATLQTFLNREKRAGKAYSTQQKRDLFEKIQDKSYRETVTLLTAISPGALPQEKARPLSATETLIQFTANDALMGKLEELKGLLAHRVQNPTYAELFEMLADLALKKLKPATPAPESGAKSEPKPRDAQTSPPSGRVELRHSRYIPVLVKRQVFHRDQGRCTFVDPLTGRRCASRSMLEYDHVRPFSRGGETSAVNLRLLCNAHHRLREHEPAMGA